MTAIALPYLFAESAAHAQDILARNGGFLAIIANIVVGVGFLGGGIILKTQEHVHGLTTAATVWVAAAVGILAGIGLLNFALVSALLTALSLYLLRHVNLRKIRPDGE
jgi:uncharacterized membrane protein YhiD involved in acid resistance